MKKKKLQCQQKYWMSPVLVQMLRWAQKNWSASSQCACSFQCQFHQPWNQNYQNVRWNNSKTHSSSLGKAANKVALRSKKGLINRGIHLATCRKVSMASVNLIMISPGIEKKNKTYLSSCTSFKHMLSKTKLTTSEGGCGAGSGDWAGMMVVGRKEWISSWHVDHDASDCSHVISCAWIPPKIVPKAQHHCT